MRKICHLLMILSLLLQLVACELIYIVRPDFLEYVDKLIADQEYSKAEQILLHVDSLNPNYGELRLRLEKVQHFIHAYETGIINQANLLEAQGRWQIAEDMYVGGLNTLPFSQQLREAKAAFMQRNQHAVNKLKAQALINNITSLLNNKAIYDELLHTAYRDRRINSDIKHNNHELKKAIPLLLSYGQEALNKGDYLFAHECLSLAYRLSPVTEIREILDIAGLHLASEDTVAITVMAEEKPAKKATTTKLWRHSNHTKIKTAEEPILLRAYMEAVRSGRLHQAVRYMEMLMKQQPASKEINGLKSDLDRLIATKVEVEYDVAVRLYSEGDVKQALAVWKSILPLDPGNIKLKSDIARAKRVLANIRRITDQHAN